MLANQENDCNTFFKSEINENKNMEMQNMDYYNDVVLDFSYFDDKNKKDEISFDLGDKTKQEKISKYLKKLELRKQYSNIKKRVLREKNDIYNEEVNKKRFKTILNNSSIDVYYYLTSVAKTYSHILKQRDDRLFNVKKLFKEKDAVALSIILSVFLTDNDVKKIFEKYHLTLNKILNYYGLKEDIIKFSKEKKEDKIDIEDTIFKIICHLDDISSSNLTIEYFALKSLENTNFLSLLEYFKISNEILKYEIETKKDYLSELTIKEKKTFLEKQTIDELDINSNISILEFGNSLIPHSNTILDEFTRLKLSNAHNKSVEEISKFINKLYSKPNCFLNVLCECFGIDQKKKVNLQLLNKLKKVIEENMQILLKEIEEYGNLCDYIKSFLKINKEYLLIETNEIEKLKSLTEEKKDINETSMTNLFKTSIVNSTLKNLQNKKFTFSTTNILMEQKLIEVIQEINNCFITVNTLKVTNNNLIPLIELEVIQSQISEEKALDLTDNIISLFDSLLLRNNDKIAENIEYIKKSDVSQRIFSSFAKEVNYITGLFNQTDNAIAENTKIKRL